MVYIYVCVCVCILEYYSAIKNNEIMPVAAKWIDLEIYHTNLSKSERERQIPYITYMWNLKCSTNQHIHETETDS